MIGLHNRFMPFTRKHVVQSPPATTVEARPRTRRDELEDELAQAQKALDMTTQAMRRYGRSYRGAELLEAECTRIMRIRMELQSMGRLADRGQPEPQPDSAQPQ